MRPTSRIPYAGWRTVLLCFLAQNCAIGFMTGSFGPLLASTEQHFGVTRAVAAGGMSATGLAIGLLSPFLGGLLQRVPVRAAMIAGALISAAAYWSLAVLNSFGVALVSYALIGAGAGLLGILGPVTLISRWFKASRAKMLSLVNLPIVMLTVPIAVAELLPSHGRFAVLGGIGTIFLILILALTLIVESPEQIGQDPYGNRSDDGKDMQKSVDEDERQWSSRDIVTSAPFWLLSLGIGLMTGSASIFVVHIIAYGAELGMALQVSAGLLSVFAGAGIAGLLVFGWVADRVGPPAALVAATCCQALMWCILLNVSGSALFVVSAIIGMCVGPLVTLHGAAMSTLVGAASVSRAMGMSYTVKLPFIFGFAPLAGLMFDRTGSYQLPFLFSAVALVVAAMCFLWLMLLIRRRHAPNVLAPIQ